MKIPGNPFKFLKVFFITFVLIFIFASWPLVDGVFSFGFSILYFLFFSGLSLILANGISHLSYKGSGLKFDASGVTEYGSFGFVRHHAWDEFKFRCIISHEGKRERFYFSPELRPTDFFDVTVLYRPKEQRKNHKGTVVSNLFDSNAWSIRVDYTQERYEAFRASCPDIRFIRMDTEGSVYYITDSEEEILIAESKSPKEESTLEKFQKAIEKRSAASEFPAESEQPNKALTLEKFQEAIERLAASGFPDVAGILSATGLQLLEEAAAKANAVEEAEVPAKEAAEEIRASAESDSAEEAVEAIRASAAREVEEIRASTARELEAIRASAAAFVDEDSEVEAYYEDEFADEEYEDEFAEEYYEEEEFADEDE